MTRNIIKIASIMLMFQACGEILGQDTAPYNIRNYESVSLSDQVIFSTQDVANSDDLGLFLGTGTQTPELLDAGFVNEFYVYQKDAKKKIFYIEGEENRNPKRLVNTKIMQVADRAVQSFDLRFNNQSVGAYQSILFNASCECFVLKDSDQRLLLGRLSSANPQVNLIELGNVVQQQNTVAFSQDGNLVYWLGVDGGIYFSPTNAFQAKVFYKKAGDFVSSFQLTKTDDKLVYVNSQDQLKIININELGNAAVVNAIVLNGPVPFDFGDQALQLSLMSYYWKSSADGELLVFNANDQLYVANLSTMHAQWITTLHTGFDPFVFTFVDFYQNPDTQATELLLSQLFQTGTAENSYLNELRLDQYNGLSDLDVHLLRSQGFELQIALPSDVSNFMALSDSDASVYLALVKSSLNTDIIKFDLSTGATSNLTSLDKHINSIKLTDDALIMNTRDGAAFSSGEILFELGLNNGLLSLISLQ